MNCSKCGKSIKGNEKYCAHCGASVPMKTVENSARVKPKKRRWKILSVALVVIFFLVFGIGFYLWKSGKIEIDFKGNQKVENILSRESNRNEEVENIKIEKESEDKNNQEKMENVLHREINYDNTGRLTGWEEFKYDEYGDVAEYISYDTEGHITGFYDQWEYQYVKEYDGNEVVGGYSARFIHEYDEQGIITKHFFINDFFSEQERNLGWTGFEYDEVEQLVKETRYYQLPQKYTKEIYHKKGKFVGEKDYDENGVLFFEMNYEYDGQGKLLGREEYYNDEYFGGSETSYDESGRVDKITNFGSEGEVTNWSVNDYANDGTLKKTTYYDADGNVTGWKEYEYMEVTKKEKDWEQLKYHGVWSNCQNKNEEEDRVNIVFRSDESLKDIFVTIENKMYAFGPWIEHEDGTFSASLYVDAIYDNATGLWNEASERNMLYLKGKVTDENFMECEIYEKNTSETKQYQLARINSSYSQRY